MGLNIFKKISRRNSTIHILSDSHGEFFKKVDFTQFQLQPSFCIVPGATASGLANPNSKTKALPIFKEYLKKNFRRGDIIIVELGEVDCGFTIWLRSQREEISIETQLDQTLDNFEKFLNELKSFTTNNVFVLSAVIPTILDEVPKGEIANLRKEIKATIAQRTALTISFNKSLEKLCIKNGIRFISLDNALIDENTGLIKAEYRNSNALDHHLNAEKLAALFEQRASRVWAKKDVAHIFLHLHKCGGTSLMNCIDLNYNKRKIYRIEGSRFRDSYRDFKSLPDAERNEIELLRGHHFFGSHAYLKSGSIYFTMLREPYSRLASLYNYLREIDLFEEINRNNLSISEFLDSGLAMAADNGMTRMLTNYDFPDIVNGDIDENLALVAIDNLEKYFVAIGLTERFEESIELFKKKLGWNKSVPILKENKTSKKYLNKSDIELFFKNNPEYQRFIAADLKVYQYAQDRFSEDIKIL